MADGSSSPPSLAVVDGWSREEEKAFEEALADLAPWNEGEEEKKLHEVAARVPTKSPEEVRRHYEVLVEDIRAIEGGKVAVPCYVGEEKEREKEGERERKGGVFDGGGERRSGGGGGGLSKSEQERRKGIPWTEEEHKLFLLGLSKFGKGDWRSISRNFVISRTPTQVASHAQKYFIRLNSMNRDRRRSSIHDITSVNGGEVASSQPPITGHNNAAAIGPSANNPPQTSMSGMGVYGAPVGQPLTGHMVSAVGTPVMLPPGRAPYVVPLAYPVPPPPAMLNSHIS